MPEFLTFTLAAPLAAMGEIAVGERRSGWDRPSRSALLGLVAACLGIDRRDEEAHLALEAGYGLAVRVENLGTVLADYHTAQVPSAKRGRHFATRAEELDLPSHELNTILSRRDYRADLLAFVALWPRDDPRWPLQQIVAALRAPHFVPFFGRKSCPLMLPFAPVIADAADAVAALAAYAAAQTGQGLLPRPRPPGPVVIAMDAADVGNHKVQRVELRRDRLASRRRWQFLLREEAVLGAP